MIENTKRLGAGYEVSVQQPLSIRVPTRAEKMALNLTNVESDPQSSGTPHLELVNGQVPYRDAVVSWKLPKVRLLGEERYISFELDCVTHVVLQISDARQQQVFAQIGVQHDYDYPFPFWHFLGKMISQALLENETSLEILSFTRVNDHEFVGFENKNSPKSNNSTDLNVIEVSLKRPQPNEPMEIFWRPARGIIIQRLRECEYREGYTSGL
ncbi:hypothetical protein FGLOB1_13147 [Fusarium globosum]|uniref:Uncharacterized protein n=1 Tax=Fusarium globosum TaxID=78864 RepID=A0A8H5XNG2_9HYPO|nr:hypothetical protein FGLOB1_13147 [Fusarium globosum]